MAFRFTAEVKHEGLGKYRVIVASREVVSKLNEGVNLAAMDWE